MYSSFWVVWTWAAWPPSILWKSARNAKNQSPGLNLAPRAHPSFSVPLQGPSSSKGCNPHRTISAFLRGIVIFLNASIFFFSTWYARPCCIRWCTSISSRRKYRSWPLGSRLVRTSTVSAARWSLGRTSLWGLWRCQVRFCVRCPPIQARSLRIRSMISLGIWVFWRYYSGVNRARSQGMIIFPWIITWTWHWLFALFHLKSSCSAIFFEAAWLPLDSIVTRCQWFLLKLQLQISS